MDDLLAVVLHLHFEAMNNMLNNHNWDKSLSLEVFTSEEYHHKSMQNVNIITCYRKEFKLLFLYRQESRFKEYLEPWIEKNNTIGMVHRLTSSYALNEHSQLSAGYDWFEGNERMFCIYKIYSEIWTKAKQSF